MWVGNPRKVVMKVHVNVGTIGHVDHGKTTLTAAITKVMAAARRFPLHSASMFGGPGQKSEVP